MKLADRFDFWILGPVLYLMFVGLLMSYSISHVLFFRQSAWVALGILIIFACSFVNLRALLSYRWVILTFYGVMCLLLLATHFFATTIAGTKSWIVIGPAQIQTSEFMKAALVLLFSRFFASRHVAIASFRTISISFLYTIVPLGLILIQPDLGTALIICGLWFGYLLVSELPLRHTFGFIALALVIFVLGWNFALAGYQKDRISAIFNESYDPLGVNYNVIQSKIAIGSGGFFGKGFQQGTQVQLGFLPAASTDFVFSGFVEEWGILGGLSILLAFFILIYRLAIVGGKQNNNFYKFLCLGTIILVLLHLAVNLGSALGLLPVIGIPLPFVSYGGSNLLTLSLLIGIIVNIAGRKAGF